MLTVYGKSSASYCDRLSRRDFLQVGALAGTGLTLPNLLRLQAQAAGTQPAAPSRGKSVIMIILGGGPSQLDMYDMKPEAPVEYRGEFKPIRTKVAGTHISEMLPGQSKIMDKMSVVRSMTWVEPDHQRAEVCTGFPTRAKRPSFGSIISRLYERGNPLLPKFVSLSGDDGEIAMFEDPQYVGAEHRGFFPSGPGLENLRLPNGVTLERLDDRRQLLGSLDKLRRDIDASGDIAGSDVFTGQAIEMVTSDKVREAFDISKEPQHVVERYGGKGGMFKYHRNDAYWNAQLFLRARRLAEAGVPFVSLQAGVWDHHCGAGLGSIFESYRTGLPWYDRSITALIADLYERGLDKDVAVIVWGEFGRTPRLNQFGGRDHWPAAGFTIFAGGGLKMGQMIGETDSRAERPTTRAYNPQNALATLYHVLGIDPSATIPNRNGRPMYLLDDQETISELI